MAPVPSHTTVSQAGRYIRVDSYFPHIQHRRHSYRRSGYRHRCRRHDPADTTAQSARNYMHYMLYMYCVHPPPFKICICEVGRQPCQVN